MWKEGERMSTRLTSILIVVILLITVLAGILVWPLLPDSMASHWNMHDQVDDYIPKFWGVFIMPLVSLGMFVLFMLVPLIDPLKANVAKFRPTFNLFILFMIAFLAYIWTLSILWNLGSTGFRMSTAILPAMGLLFVFVAYLLRKAKRNFFIGIRTPWTLSSDSVWDATHRLGSWLYLASGIVTLLGPLFGDLAFWFVLVPILASTVVLVVYSYVLYRREAH
jgi:uncharacterized membrane protein